jgi:hypothetical protein
VLNRVVFLLSLCIFLFGSNYIKGQDYFEDFSTYSGGETTGNDYNYPYSGSTPVNSIADWTTTYTGGGTFAVNSAGYFEADNTGSEGIWESEVVDISSSEYVDLTLDISWYVANLSGLFTSAEDYIQCYYQLDGGTPVLFYEHRSAPGTETSSTTSVSNILSGSTVKIIIRILTDNILLLGFIPVGTNYYQLDNITLTPITKIYSYNGGGNWTNGNSWSYDPFSAGSRTAAGSAPATDQIAIIGNNDVINFNTDDQVAGLVVENTGSLLYSGNNRDLYINQGLVKIDNGGVFSENSTTNGTLRFMTADMISSLVNNGSFSSDEIRFENAGIKLTVSGSSTTSISVINAVNNSIDMINQGIISSGNFSNFPTTNSVSNTDGAEWYFTGTNTSDADVQLYCDDGANLFAYSLSGIQNVYAPQDAYSNLTFSNSGAKSLQGSFTVKGDLTVSGTASISPGTNTVTLGGISQQDLDGTIGLYGLTINNSASGNAIIINDAVTVSGVLTLTDGIINTFSGSLSLTAATASVSGGSDACFVNGAMTYTGVAGISVTFPIGKVDRIHQAIVSVTGTSANYTAEYFETPASALGYTLPGTLTHVSNVGYWTITNVSTPVTTASVTLYYNVDDEVTDPPNLRIAKDDGSGSWLDIGGTGTGTPTGNIASTTNFTSFSAFALANGLGGANPLPVEWLSFKGKQEGNGINLTWQTASEKENDYFTIERSQDGRDFNEIGEIPGSGTTHSISTYQFFDENPVIGIGYYRIRQTDYNGHYDFSRIIAVEFNPFDGPSLKDEELLIFPNPANERKIRILVNSRYVEKEMELTVLDLTGRIYLLKSVRLKDNMFDLTVEKTLWSPGVYSIRLAGRSNILTGKLIIR